MIDRDELLQFLRDNLRLDTKEHSGWYGDNYVDVMIMLGDQEVSSVCINMPRSCRHSDSY